MYINRLVVMATGIYHYHPIQLIPSTLNSRQRVTFFFLSFAKFLNAQWNSKLEEGFKFDHDRFYLWLWHHRSNTLDPVCDCLSLNLYYQDSNLKGFYPVLTSFRFTTGKKRTLDNLWCCPWSFVLYVPIVLIVFKLTDHHRCIIIDSLQPFINIVESFTLSFDVLIC